MSALRQYQYGRGDLTRPGTLPNVPLIWFELLAPAQQQIVRDWLCINPPPHGKTFLKWAFDHMPDLPDAAPNVVQLFQP